MYYADSVEPITLTTSTSTVTNLGSVFSEPVIAFIGSGEFSLMVGTQIVELSDITESIMLDTPLMEVYSGIAGMNDCMIYEFPTLAPGTNAISWSGEVKSVVIQPNWRFL